PAGGASPARPGRMTGRPWRRRQQRHEGDMGELEGKGALITGAGARIGRAAARVFAEAGAAVGLCDVDEASGTATTRAIEQAGGRALFVQTDVADPDGVRR